VKVYSRDFDVKTDGRRQVVNITAKVEAMIRNSGVKEGMALIFTHHTTTALVLNEDEPGLRQDLLTVVSALYDRAGYRHDLIDRNAASHLAASFAGPSLTLPIRDGRLIRGTWQSLLLLELDGPRFRTITVHIMGTTGK